MLPSLLLVLTLAADPVPPVVGRPLDFSGAVGGPFVVTLAAEPTALAPEEPLTLTVRIAGPGDLAGVRRPDLAKLDAFKGFAVEALDEALVPGDAPRREFRYRLRPRTAAVTEVPALKFVYFNPRMPPSRGYMTTYSEAVPLTVKAKTPPVPAAPTEVPVWMLDAAVWGEAEGYPASELSWQLRALGQRIGLDWSGGRWRALGVVVGLLVVLPPFACAGWYAAWKRRNPDAARFAAQRRSRAAAEAVRVLHRTSIDTPTRVASAVTGYLRSRFDLPGHLAAPFEVVDALRVRADVGCAEWSEAHRIAPNTATLPSGPRSTRHTLLADTADLLRRCDAARFGPAGACDVSAAEAERLILAWEAEQ